MSAGIPALPISHRKHQLAHPKQKFQAGRRALTRRILKSGEHLYRAGETSTDAYLVCSGALESYYIHADGEEQILGLHGVGEVVGFDSLFSEPASASVKAVNTSSIRILPNPARMLGLHDCGSEARTILYAMRDEIRRCTQRLHMERHPSDRRLAEFVLDFSERAGKRGQSTTCLVLPVSRRVLSRYLGMAPETLSRTLSNFQARGILYVNNREISIVEPAVLRAIANP